jgi:hypothetical protein
VARTRDGRAWAVVSGAVVSEDSELRGSESSPQAATTAMARSTDAVDPRRIVRNLRIGRRLPP